MCPPVRVAGVSPAPGPLPEPSNPQHEGKFSILGSVQSDRNFHPDFCKTSCQVEYNAHSQGSSSSASRTWPEAARSALGLSQGAGAHGAVPGGRGPGAFLMALPRCAGTGSAQHLASKPAPADRHTASWGALPPLASPQGPAASPSSGAVPGGGSAGPAGLRAAIPGPSWEWVSAQPVCPS